jgi:hypothetical protein
MACDFADESPLYPISNSVSALFPPEKGPTIGVSPNLRRQEGWQNGMDREEHTCL